ncbi:hypothetical protein B0H15DRAFT_797267 [Mycena belliarum]|uniref:Solute carrier family 35 member F6 n=1 Tax=Mycena belliarum TaxID=1033014 RepID=A0AAD6UDL7_9AGAR|nr:hypothetical protein B0H15DRAFT_797267 [Mycena belliae]
MPSRLRTASSTYKWTMLLGMLVLGSSMSLCQKWQNLQCIENCDSPNPADKRYFEQPSLQTLQMFVGEAICLVIPAIRSLASYTNKKTSDEDRPLLSQVSSKPEKLAMRGSAWFLLAIPAVLDMAASTMVNIGMIYTPLSIFQMTRGALVLFVALLSVTVLRRRVASYQWFSVAVVIVSLILVGFGGFLKEHAEGGASTVLTSKVVVGMMFILLGLALTSLYLVIEESVVSRYELDVLTVVGVEGMFGCALLLFIATLSSVAPALVPAPVRALADLGSGVAQMVAHPRVLVLGALATLSISLFDFFGVSITLHLSATARVLTDIARTVILWAIALAVGWEALTWPASVYQVLGLLGLVAAVLTYHGVIELPSSRSRRVELVEE